MGHSAKFLSFCNPGEQRGGQRNFTLCFWFFIVPKMIGFSPCVQNTLIPWPAVAFFSYQCWSHSFHSVTSTPCTLTISLRRSSILSLVRQYRTVNSVTTLFKWNQTVLASFIRIKAHFGPNCSDIIRQVWRNYHSAGTDPWSWWNAESNCLQVEPLCLGSSAWFGISLACTFPSLRAVIPNGHVWYYTCLFRQ